MIFFVWLVNSGSVTNTFDKELGERKFEIDKVVYNDEAKRLQTVVSIPISGIVNLDKSVKTEILLDRDKFIKNLAERIANDNGEMSEIGSDYSCEIESIFEDEKFISYSLIISDYYGGSAHPVSRFKTYNFDLKKKSIVRFGELFSVKTKSDTLELISIMNKAINNENAEVKRLDKMEFNFSKDSISFNFDDYEIASYAEGLIKATVSKEHLKKFINSNYW